MFDNLIEFIENGTFSNMKEVNLLDLSDNIINIDDIEPFIKSWNLEISFKKEVEAQLIIQKKIISL